MKKIFRQFCILFMSAVLLASMATTVAAADTDVSELPDIEIITAESGTADSDSQPTAEEPAAEEPTAEEPETEEPEITPQKQSIKCKIASSYKVAETVKSFKLGAKAQTKLTYKSSNTSVAKVSKTGKVTVKGIGKATITITAKATDAYKAAKKTIKLTVIPKAPEIKRIVNSSSSFLTIQWDHSKNYTTDQLQISKTKKFKKIFLSANTKQSYAFYQGVPSGVYYIRVRTLTKKNGETFRSKWSDVKRVNVR